MTGAVNSVNLDSSSFGYDADGNRTSDGRTGLEFSYNILNLPCEVHDDQQNMQMRYTYLVDGTKISALDAAGNGLLYRGNFVYEKTGSTFSLESIAADEGRIVMDGTSVRDRWHVKDHLGNVRSVVWINAPSGTGISARILEQNDYLLFGTKAVNGSQPGLSTNRYRYAGKEEQRFGSFNSQLLDFGSRCYDAFTCRWTSTDPLAYKYFGLSPYNYCGNDPVNRFDPDGEEVRPLGEEELEVIRNTLPKEARQYVQLNEQGTINKELLSQCSIESCNIEALKALVNSDVVFEYSIDAAYYGNLFYDNGDGNFCYGVTMMPRAEIDPSPDDNVYVITADFLKGEKKASNAAHELFGHAYFYELKRLGKDVNPNHTFGNTGETRVEYVEGLGNLDVAIFGRTNTLLENQIKKVENEAIINFKLK